MSGIDPPRLARRDPPLRGGDVFKFFPIQNNRSIRNCLTNSSICETIKPRLRNYLLLPRWPASGGSWCGWSARQELKRRASLKLGEQKRASLFGLPINPQLDGPSVRRWVKNRRPRNAYIARRDYLPAKPNIKNRKRVCEKIQIGKSWL